MKESRQKQRSNQGKVALFLSQPKNISFLFYSLWMFVSIFQARFTGLWNDEAYYWEYSRNLAWGYFDHPPMIALLIKAGYFLFPNELGVRFFVILLSTGTIFFMEKILQPANRLLYYIIVASLGILQIGGMIAVPDIPLLFFSASFLWLYKRYLDQDSLANSLFLALNIVLLLLSKYHGILIIGFTLLSNLKLLQRKSFWIIVTTSVILMVPHIYWQYENGWPSIYYHLYGHSPKPYKFSQTLKYVFDQLAVPGSLTAILLWYYGFRAKPKDLFERALKFNLIGIYIFFFVMSFKSKIEANWTVPVFIPLIILAYQQSYLNKKAKKLYGIFFVISMVIIFAARIFLLVDFLPGSSSFKPEFHKWDKWAQQIHQVAGDLPVVFENSYQKPSKYEFYTHQTAFAINTPAYRRSIFDYRNTENELQGKKVILFSGVSFEGSESLLTSQGTSYYKVINNFRLFSKINILPEKNNYTMKAGIPVQFTFSMEKDENIIADFNSNPELPSYIYYGFFKNESLIYYRKTDFLLSNQTSFEKPYQFKLIPPEEKGTYYLSISIKTGWLPPTINGRKVIVEVN